RRQPACREAARNVAQLADPGLRYGDRHDGKSERVRREESAELQTLVRRARRYRVRGCGTATPSTESEQRHDRDRRQEAEVRSHVPVGRGRLERGKPSERVDAEDLVQNLLPLLLEAVVQSARRHRAENEG